MKLIITLISFALALSTGCAQKTTTAKNSAAASTGLQQNTPVNEEAATIKKDSVMSTGRSELVTDTIAIPDCIAKKIAGFKSESMQNPPRKVFRYGI